MHAIHRVVAFELVGTYRLQVAFEDGVSRLIDLEPLLEGELFGPLRDPVVFGGVRLDPEANTLVWPNGADLDPATLHDWPSERDELIRRAGSWKRAGASPRR